MKHVDRPKFTLDAHLIYTGKAMTQTKYVCYITHLHSKVYSKCFAKLGLVL